MKCRVGCFLEEKEPSTPGGWVNVPSRCISLTANPRRPGSPSFEEPKGGGVAFGPHPCVGPEGSPPSSSNRGSIFLLVVKWPRNCRAVSWRSQGEKVESLVEANDHRKVTSFPVDSLSGMPIKCFKSPCLARPDVRGFLNAFLTVGRRVREWVQLHLKSS